jgi:signal transduction histidine kinase
VVRQKVELKITEGDLDQLVTKTLDDFQHCTKVPIDRDLQQLPGIAMDAEQLQKVVTNLVLNAHEACNGKGTIRVATSHADHQVILSVTDDGCGMTQRFIEGSLFRPFQSTKKRGIGIGLFQSKMIVQAHHGRIEVESEEGKGSTFRVVLPVRQNPNREELVVCATQVH